MAKAAVDTVLLAGEPPLAGEMAELCRSRGLAVDLRAAGPRRRRRAGTRVKAGGRGRTAIAFELTHTDPEAKRENLRLIESGIGPSVPILSTSVTVTVGEQAHWTRHPERLVGISALPGMTSGGLLELAAGSGTDASAIRSAGAFLQRLGKETAVVQDRVGMVTPRILCGIINEAFFALTEDAASPRDIDTAMKLGTNYPFGPVEWAQKIGIRHILCILEALHRDLGDDRYRVAPLLRQLANV